ncbi:hypothetical protein ABBQ32_013307 [Trebouxia sp. C0010 RCD-2024]
MAQVSILDIVRFPSWHNSNHRRFLGSPHQLRRTSPAFGTKIQAQGSASAPHLQLCCDSCQSTCARVEGIEGPDISLLEPAVKKQWDHAANAWLGHIVVKPYSSRKVAWICDQCPDGHLHSWSAFVYSRTCGSGCPQCSGHAVCKHNSLATKAPLMAAQWDYEANNGTPDDVVAQSNHKLHWHCCECGCKWSATPNSRVSKGGMSGCPQCAQKLRSNKRITYPTFAECKHPLLAEWDHDRNAARGNFPDNTKLKSGKQIFWLCDKCPAAQEHSWSTKPSLRTSRNKTDCPFCAGKNACRCNSMQALYPDTAAEWDYTKDQGQPSDYPSGSTYLAWWSSPQRGSWQATIHARTTSAKAKSARLIGRQQRLDATHLF